MQNNNFNNKIKDILSDYCEEPSNNCWNSIEQQLNQVLPVSNANPTVSTNSFSKFISSATGKVVAVISSVSIVTASLIIINNSNETNNELNNKPIIAQNETPTQKDSIIELTNTEIALDNKIKEISAKPKTLFNDKITETNNSNNSLISNSLSVNSNIIINQPTINNINNIVTTPANSVNKSEEPIQKKAEVVNKEENNIKTNEDIIETNNSENQEIDKSTKIIIEKIPNVITPNGDGYNDYLVFQGIENCTKSRLLVFNIRGGKVFEATNYQNNWDGGSCIEGSYYYILELVNKDKSITNIRESLRIIR